METIQSAALRHSNNALDGVCKLLSVHIIIHKEVLPPNAVTQMTVKIKASTDFS